MVDCAQYVCDNYFPIISWSERDMTHPSSISRRRFNLFLLSGSAAAILAGCEGGELLPQPKIAANVAPVGGRVELKCFTFRFRNTFRRPIYDVHVPLDEDPVLIHSPPGWGTTDDEVGFGFITPPPTLPGTTQERPAPVPVGGLSGRYTFYLPEDSDATSTTIQLSFKDGSRVPVDDVWQGGKPVPVGPDGLKHIKRSDKAYCREIAITAPTGAEVKDIHLDRIQGGNPTEFIDVELPSGWVSNPVDPGSITIFTEGNGPGIPPGGALNLKVYFTSPNARASWRLTDGSGTIPGAEGTVNL
jgi:hypothetical protein